MIDFTKPVRTIKEKTPVRILCTDGPGTYSVVGIERGRFIIYSWTLEGEHVRGKGVDLENYEPDQFVWLNVYESDKGGLRTGANWSSREQADYCHEPRKVGRLKIKLERRWDE